MSSARQPQQTLFTSLDDVRRHAEALPCYQPELPLVISSDVLRKDRCPPGQFLTEKWPVLHVGSPPSFDRAAWRFRVSGLCERPFELTYDALLALPQVQVYSDIHCVTRWSRLDNLWVGVSARTLVDMAGPQDKAVSVMLHADPGYTTNIPLKDFLEEDVFFTWWHNGGFIDQEHGFPLRAVVPKLYLWKGAKWVTGMEFMRRDKPGYWEIRGYHIHGDPWKEERFW